MSERRRARRSSAPGAAGEAPAAAAAPADAAEEAGGEPAFEVALDELESLVDRLEDGDLALEQALATFERGVALSRRCAELLDRAERRIEVLVRQGDGVAVAPFDEPDDEPEAG